LSYRRRIPFVQTFRDPTRIAVVVRTLSDRLRGAFQPAL